MDEQISGSLDRIQDLTDDELAGVETNILSTFDSIDAQDPNEESVTQMLSLADGLDAVRAESGRRATRAAELASQAQSAIDRVKGSSETTSEVTLEDGGAEPSTDEEVAEAAEEVEPTDKEEVVAVAASAENEETPTVEDVPEVEAVETVEEIVASAEEPETEEEAAPADAEVPAEEVNDNPETVVEPEAVTEEVPVEEVPAEEPEAEAVVADAAPNDDNPIENNQPEETVTAAASSEQSPIEGAPDFEAPADRRPTIQVHETSVPVTITAGAEIQGIAQGATLDDMDAVAEAMVKRLSTMGRVKGGDGEQFTVASITASFPEDRILGKDYKENMQKIEAVTSPEAITAAGGLCAPVNVRYELFGLGDSYRPVRDSLPSFNADRGGIRFIAPPVLTDLSGSVALWTVQDDIDAATAGAPDPTKPCLRVACGAETTVQSDAITLCLTFGNMGARAYPELVARHNELGLIWQARFAETRLLTRIGSLSTAVTAARYLGTAADFFQQVDRAASAYRNRHRIKYNSPLRVILPEWFRAELRGDFAFAAPGGDPEANLSIADATVDQMFRVRNINVTWAADGESGQVLGAQAAGSLNDWPTTLVWYIFAEGTFIYLDGGVLDLGIVRDSTLNSVNDYKFFAEEFGGVAKVGVESVKITSTLIPNGARAAALATASAVTRPVPAN